MGLFLDIFWWETRYDKANRFIFNNFTYFILSGEIMSIYSEFTACFSMPVNGNI